MSRSIPRAPALTALALAVALTAACAPTLTAPVEPTPTVEPAPVVAVEPTPEPDETTTAPEPAPEPAGLVYTLEDGTKVEIDPAAKKLPKKVRKDLARKATEAASGGASDWERALRDAEKTSGRRVIMVMRTYGQPEGKPEGHYWTIGANPTAIHPPVETKAEAVAIAEAHVAAQDDPTAWAIVISDQ